MPLDRRRPERQNGAKLSQRRAKIPAQCNFLLVRAAREVSHAQLAGASSVGGANDVAWLHSPCNSAPFSLALIAAQPPPPPPPKLCVGDQSGAQLSWRNPLNSWATSCTLLATYCARALPLGAVRSPFFALIELIHRVDNKQNNNNNNGPAGGSTRGILSMEFVMRQFVVSH